ncbi:MAG TPA: hypothetical protein H9675_01995 [Firmicutes bacterium]|nr:hypothetical protein [Bacillota bacterium]
MVRNKSQITILYVSLVIYTALLMFFCTKSSPLYITNDWPDANAYFTMGKGMMNGAVPYKDLFDHKGPLLYLIYGIGYLIDNTGFFGVFLFQVASMSLVVIFSFKIAELYTKSSKSSAVIALFVPVMILAGGLYINGADLGGGSPDEFAAPLIVMSLYFAIRLFKDKKAIVSGHLEMFAIGLLGGLIVLLKFNIFAFTVGLMAPLFIYLAVKQFRIFLKSVGFIALGFVIPFIPYLIYAAITGSLNDFIDVYIKFNMTYASTEDTNLLYTLCLGIKNGISIIINDYFIHFIIIAFGLLYFIYSNRKNAVLNISIFLSFALLLISLTVKFWPYQFIPAAVFCIFGYLAFYDLYKKIKARLSSDKTPLNKDRNKAGGAIIPIFTILLIFTFTVGNNGLIAQLLNRATNINPNPSQQEIANVILKDTKENQTMLEVLSLDSGFYTAAGIVPSSRYFYMPNVTFELYPDVFISQYEDIEAGINKYLVTSFLVAFTPELEQQPIDKNNYGQKIQNAISKHYELIYVAEGHYYTDGRIQYLYRRVD